MTELERFRAALIHLKEARELLEGHVFGDYVDEVSPQEALARIIEDVEYEVR